MIHRTIRTLEGRVLATAGFTGPQPPVWEWVQETVAAECECCPDEVTGVENDDGDLIILARGEPVFKI